MRPLPSLLASLALAFATACNMSLSNGSSSSDLAELEARAAALSPAPATSSSSTPATSSSTTTAAKPTSSVSSSSGSGSGPAGGFLWKPVSESNGNLVVLLPSAYKGVTRITVSGAITESSSRSAIANGDRPHYRFSRPGAAYGKNIKVSGGGRTWTVADGSKRTSL